MVSVWQPEFVYRYFCDCLTNVDNYLHGHGDRWQWLCQHSYEDSYRKSATYNFHQPLRSDFRMQWRKSGTYCHRRQYLYLVSFRYLECQHGFIGNCDAADWNNIHDNWY